MQTVEEKLNAIIADMLEVEESEIKPEQSFRADLGADSLDLMELIMAIEEEFEEEISDAEAQKITTVGEAYNYVNTRLAEAESG